MTKHTTLPPAFRCAVTLGVDFDGPSHEVGRGIAPLGAHSCGRYSARCGIPRHIEMLADQGVPCTFFVPGYDAQCHPDTVRAIDAAGFEIAAHGYLHEAWDLGAEEETRLLHRTDGILRDLLGKPVLGWRSPSGRKTANTMQVLKSMGYLYDSSDKDYDLPYRLRFGENEDDSILELPNNTYSLDDFPFYKFSFTPPSEVLAQWKSEFDAIYASDRFMVLTVHPRSGWGSGTPARTGILEQMIGYMKEHEGVHFFSSAQFARWCLEHPQHLEEVRVP
ncbi:MAG: polysaccharide deacetylase family protein [Betaproteobacteria bacterium]|nr:polysaccharide deacetylase family protein [Betaproteobacteria bacterium]